MSHKNNPSDYRRVKIATEYAGFDFLTIKKPQQCSIRIPQTILLDRNGSPKDWIFNSGKLPHHPILKKRKQNLVPLLILKTLCSKHINPTALSTLKNIPQLKQYAKTTLNQRKDAEFFNKRKSIQIRTVNDQILQLSLLQFLDYVGQNKQAEQNFYQKWKMIQQRVSSSKIDESYIVESVRRNHIIESKSSKQIAVSTGNKINIEYDENDPFSEVSPSKELEVTDTKAIQGYKFFDTYLNKKFFSAIAHLIDSIQKNFKCIVESLVTKFVIDHDREPHLAGIDQIFIKPALKIFEMKEFGKHVVGGQIKLETYMKCLHQFLIEHPARLETNLQQPLSQQRAYKCKGDFCDTSVLSIPHLPQRSLRLPLIASANVRKMSGQLIESVKKRKMRVIQKLKETKVLDPNYQLQSDQSSQFSQDQSQLPVNAKVCENCFIFYINVLKNFELDAHSNLVEKKGQSTRGKIGSEDSNRKKSVNEEIEKEMLSVRRSEMKSLKNLHEKEKTQGVESQNGTNLRRSASHHNSKLRPLDQSPKDAIADEIKQEPKRKTLLSKGRKDIQLKTNKLIESKLSNMKLRLKQKQSPSKKVQLIKSSNFKSTNYHQAAQQLLHKLESLPNASADEFMNAAKSYYTTNLPQQIQRYCFSSEYLTHLYDFMNNSILGTAPGNRIKKRPQMTLKRLSQLTSYPQIVSRSTFLFDTLICDQKTTIPFCLLSTSMIHHNNHANKPYQNIFILHDLFDSYIEYISLSKELLQDTQNTRIILFNYPGQSHTIFDKNAPFRMAEISSIVDKLMYRLSAESGQLSVFTKHDSFKFIGFGYGGFLAASFLSACPALYPVVKGVALVNSAYHISQKTKNIYQSLLELYSVQDTSTEENSFLFYNKAIHSTAQSREEMEDKSGLNSIRMDGRCYLLKNALQYWDDTNHQNFTDYPQQVLLIYSKTNVTLAKTDMLKFTYRPDSDRTIIKTRNLIQIQGGHDIQVQSYDSLLKHLTSFLS